MPSSHHPQAFGNQDDVPGGPNKGNCISYMRTMCTPAMQGAPMAMRMDDNNINQTLAGFLIVRPPYAYVGYGWESDDRNWHDEFYLQAGEPTGLCEETQTGVFSRPWTLGTPVLDCNTWTATLPFQALPHA